MNPKISIVVPVYGSEKILPKLVQVVDAALREYAGPGSFELILVNDCSPDGSWAAITGLCSSHPWVRALSLRKNAGQHNAIMAGLRIARGRFIVMMDDDLQHDPADIPKLVDQLEQEGYDVCYSRFRARRHALWKRAGSAFNDFVAKLLLKKPLGLYLSPFKAITRGIRDEIIRFHGPSVYLDGLILSSTKRITMVVVDHHERPDGKSGYSLRKSISLWLKMATNFSVAPLRLASWLGMFFSMMGFLAALALIIQKFTLDAMPIGWSSLIVSVLILGGIQLLALGVIGEYVGRILLQVTDAPQTVIGNSINVDSTNAPEHSIEVT
jgi:undecaprenyl-phosphate 4-deoxy-4-formamido-L-arabinose transferase